MSSINKIRLFGFILVLTFNQLNAAYAACVGAEDSDSPIIISTVIKSSAQKVWDTMVDFKNYGLWNAWVGKIDGEAKLGSVVRAYGRESDISLDLKITKLKEPHILCWDDVTWFTNLGVGGFRCRIIEELPDGSGVKFTNHFEYRGVFRWLFSLSTREMLTKGMTLENESLREYLEK